MHDNKSYTMEDLVRATGYSARQIRYYITRKLVPGAGERGPNVTYGQETLDRLELVKKLKAMKVQPAGRSLTLDEIQKTMASLEANDASDHVSMGLPLQIIDTEMMPKSMDLVFRASSLTPPISHMVCEDKSFMQELDFGPETRDLGELGTLLRSLNTTLTEMLDDMDYDTQNTHPHESAEEWRRVRIPDIEIQVRMPGDPSQSLRLERINRILERLLDHGR